MHKHVRILCVTKDSSPQVPSQGLTSEHATKSVVWSEGSTSCLEWSLGVPFPIKWVIWENQCFKMLHTLIWK